MKLRYLTALVGAALIHTPASAVVYSNSVNANGLTANYTIETDGSLGAISTQNIVKFSLFVFDGMNNFRLDQSTGGNSYISFSSLIATVSTLNFGTVKGENGQVRVSGGEITGADPNNFENGIKFRNNIAQIILTGSDRVMSGSVPITVLATASPISSVPETDTWAMMILGLGFVGGAARYRRKAVNVRFA